MTVPTLSRSGVDKAAEHRDDDVWLERAWQTGKLLVIDEAGRAAVLDDGPALTFIDAAGWSGDREHLLLGVDPDGTAYWGTVGELPKRLGARPLDLRMVGAALSDRDAGLLVTQVALSNWHATHTRCPRCGTETEIKQAGWSRHCPADGSQHFPRTDPAVIVLIHDGADRALLGRQPVWPRWSLLDDRGIRRVGTSVSVHYLISCPCPDQACA